MLWNLQRKKANIDYQYWQDTRFRFDDFEPDNNSEMPRLIFLNEIQEHNFHQDYEQVQNAVPVIIQCDEDWVRFDATCNGNFTIETSHITGWPTDANTRLTLYDGNLNQLAQNDDIDASNHFSRIVWNFTAGQSYFIRVDNMSSGVTGYYNLAIDGVQLTGPSQLCGSQIYTVTEPNGVNVNWTVMPQGIVDVNSLPPNQVELTQFFGVNGEITLTGTFIHPCDGYSSM